MGKKIFDSIFPGENITYKEKLIKCVNNKMSGHQIANEIGINYTTTHRWLRKLGLNLYNYHNELKFDNTVFDSINTEEKAYWLGFLYADGCVRAKTNTVELSLMGSDINHLRKFQEFLKYKKEPTLGVAKYNEKEFSRCRLAVTDRHFHDTLISKGCIPNKSLVLVFPNENIFSSKELIRHFIRGYIDGDGCIYIQKGYSIFNIVGTKEFLNSIKNYYPRIFSSVLHKDKRRPNSNTYSMSVSAKKAAYFGDILYKGANIFLERKYKKFIENKYDERKHFKRVHTFSEKQQLYFARASYRSRQDCHVH